jgi:hypothetical protein
MTLDDQPVDRGERPYQMLTVGNLEAVRHGDLPGELTILLSTLSVLGCGRRLR